MLRTGCTFAVGLVLTASALPQSRAQALTLTAAPFALAMASGKTSVVQNAAYICHRWWQWRGARWVRSCWRTSQEPGWPGPVGIGPAWNHPDWHDRYWW